MPVRFVDEDTKQGPTQGRIRFLDEGAEQPALVAQESEPGLWETLQERGRNIKGAFTGGDIGVEGINEPGIPGRAFRVAGQTGRAAGEIVGAGLGKLIEWGSKVVPEGAKEAAAGGLSKLANYEIPAYTPESQFTEREPTKLIDIFSGAFEPLKKGYEQKPEATKEALKDLVGIADWVPLGIGAKQAQRTGRAVKEGLGEMVERAGKRKMKKTAQLEGVADEIIDLKKPKQPSKTTKTLRKLDLPEGEWRSFSAPLKKHTIPFDEYAKASDNFSRNRNAIGPDKLSNKQLTQALKDVDVKRKQIGKAIGQTITDNADKDVFVGDVRDQFLETMGSVFNGQFDDAGNLVAVSGRELIAEPTEKKLAEELYRRLAAMPDEISVPRAQDMKQIIRQHAKFQSQTGVPVKSPRMNMVTKSLASDIDRKLDVALAGTDYTKLNAQYGKVRQLAENMGRITGAEIDPELGLSKHGSNVMKRAVWSLADGGTRDMFRAVEALTGRDLMQDAVYANLAMRFSGDPMQAMAGEPGVRGLSSLVRGGKGGLIERGIEGVEGHLKKGRLQALVDEYTKRHGRPRVKLGGTKPITQRTGLGEMISDEGGAIGGKAEELLQPKSMAQRFGGKSGLFPMLGLTGGTALGGLTLGETIRRRRAKE